MFGSFLSKAVVSIKRWWEKILNNIVYNYSKHITNLSTFYLFIFSVSWLILHYKLQKIQIDLNTNQYLYINKSIINEYTLIEKGVHLPPKDQIFNVENNLSRNNLNLNEWYTYCTNKNQLNKSIGVWTEDYDLWIKYKIDFEKKSPEIKDLLKVDLKKLDNSIKISNNNYLDLKKISLKLIFGLGLLISSDILLKLTFC